MKRRYVCRAGGCERPVHYNDAACSEHDTVRRGPMVCVCAVARPTQQWGNECANCARPVTQLWPPARYLAALRAYPQIAHQTVDWSLRMPAPPTTAVAS
jgi:hypothetical protein